uniref:Uncharacterized protein n=1 Tax=Lepeophtheirus salmonis TaxID=72036 RepID=A0A0K2UGA5_LEPSM
MVESILNNQFGSTGNQEKTLEVPELVVQSTQECQSVRDRPYHRKEVKKDKVIPGETATMSVEPVPYNSEDTSERDVVDTHHHELSKKRRLKGSYIK